MQNNIIAVIINYRSLLFLSATTTPVKAPNRSFRVVTGDTREFNRLSPVQSSPCRCRPIRRDRLIKHTPSIRVRCCWRLIKATELRLDFVDHKNSRRPVLAVNDLGLYGVNANSEQAKCHELLGRGKRAREGIGYLVAFSEAALQ